MSTGDDKFLRARITQRADYSADLWMIRIQPGAEFKFAPGQYATLGVQDPQKRHERAYSIVSSPYESEIEFFFELVPQGELTPLIYKLQVGDEIQMRKVPKGRFTLQTGSGRTNHLLVCTVTGIAPFVSYIRTLHKDWKEGKFTGEHKLFLLNGASRSWEFGYRDEPGSSDIVTSCKKSRTTFLGLLTCPQLAVPGTIRNGSARPAEWMTYCASMRTCGVLPVRTQLAIYAAIRK